MKKFMIVLLVAFLGILSCHDFSESEPEVSNCGGFVQFNLKNTSNEPIHMFITGENFNPSNKVQPGNERKTKFYLEKAGIGSYSSEKVTISAGKNGEVLDTKDVIAYDCDEIKVKWNGSSLK